RYIIEKHNSRNHENNVGVDRPLRGDPKTPACSRSIEQRGDGNDRRTARNGVSVKLEQALLRLLRLGYKDAMRRQRVENLRITFRPCIVDFHPPQAPFRAIPD